ncbi:MAG: hypothetical protein ABIC91_08470 [Nanoarchaeota archaeon]|nr:hypothetical protein [Nanoarchaeota archaeon]MBU1030330.1 hypothetical protein [Nanoarchaeota archaeon]MBU1850035.1 hypothetical protein [Nanoarchaeota archaeon]
MKYELFHIVRESRHHWVVNSSISTNHTRFDKYKRTFRYRFIEAPLAVVYGDYGVDLRIRR